MSNASGGEIARMRGVVDRLAGGDAITQMVAAVLSLLVLAAIGVALFFFVLVRYAPQTRSVDLPTLVSVIVGMWIIGGVIGWATSRAENPTYEITDHSRNPDLATAGCLLAFVQFLGGGLYGALRALARGGDPNAAERRAAAILLAVVEANQGSERATIVEMVHDADRSVATSDITAALRWLQDKNCIEGLRHLRIGPGLQSS